MIHQNIGLPVSWDSFLARIRLVRHGMESHFSSSLVGRTAAILASRVGPAMAIASMAAIITTFYIWHAM
jgi:hypothetical protein